VVTNFSRFFRGVWFERLRFAKRATLLRSQEEKWVAVGVSVNLSLRDGVLPEWRIASELLFFSSFPRVNDKREGDVFTTKWSPMWGFLSTVCALFFAVSRFHHVVATTASASFLPQGFVFDWNPPGTTVPIPITRTVDLFVKGFPVHS